VRVPELLLGILLVTGCALAALVWQRSSATTQQALVFARDVRRGDVLTPQDFAAADVRATGARLLPFADGERLVGRIVAADLSAFTPVTDDLAVDAIPLGADESLVGRRLELGHFPSGLQPGDHVTVVLVQDDAFAPTVAAAPPVPARLGDESAETNADPDADPLVVPPLSAIVEMVSSIETAAGEVVVTLRVPSAEAEAIAAAPEVRLAQVAR
jgi:hypothetical protein